MNSSLTHTLNQCGCHGSDFVNTQVNVLRTPTFVKYLMPFSESEGLCMLITDVLRDFSEMYSRR